MKRSIRRTWLPIVGAGLLGLGCASGGSNTRENAVVDPAWLARVPMDQMAPVEAARAERRQAQDSLARAKLQRQDAERSKELTEQQLEIANKERELQKERLEAAKSRGQAPLIEQAERGVYQAELAHDVALRRKELAEARVEAAKAAEELQDAHVKLETADLDRAEYNVLSAQGDVRASNIDAGELDKKREEALEETRKKEREWAEKRMKIAEAESKLGVAEQRYSASRAQPPRG